MLNDKTEERYLGYLMTYTKTILEYSDKLQKKCSTKRSGEAKINGAKYTYFATSNGISIMNLKNNLEMNFSFNNEKDFIYFNKSKFHNFIESDLNASGLGRNFTGNSIIRTNEFNECFDNLCSSGLVKVKDKGYIISVEEII